MIKNLALGFALALATPLAAQFTCKHEGLGPGCGPLLAVTTGPTGMSAEMLTLSGSNLFPLEHGIVIFGLIPLNWPVLGSATCYLYEDFTWGHSFVADAGGNYVFQRAWPHSIPGFFRFQMATLRVDGQGLLEIQVTNGVKVTCQ